MHWFYFNVTLAKDLLAINEKIKEKQQSQNL